MNRLITTALAFLAATSSIASPVPQDQPQSYGSREPRQTLYQLKVKAPDYPQIHDKYLAISEEQVGIYASRQPVIVTPSEHEEGGLVSLSTWPIGIVNHNLALIGQDGLYDLKDTIPQLTDPTPETTYSWQEFVLDESASELGWRMPGEGNWVVFPGRESGTYDVKWNEGTGFTTQNYLPIAITFEEAVDPER